MGEFTRELGETILGYFDEISDASVEPHVKERVRNFRKAPYTDCELYDFICTIGDMPVERTVCDGKVVAVVGDIDGFTQAMCDLRRFYNRPTEEPTP